MKGWRLSHRAPPFARLTRPSLRVPAALITAARATAVSLSSDTNRKPTRSAQLRSTIIGGLFLTEAAPALLDINLLGSVLGSGMPSPGPRSCAAHQEAGVEEVHTVRREDDHGAVADVCVAQ